MKPPQRCLCLVRHGDTDWTETGRIAGRSDVDLSVNGRLAVAAAGRALRDVIESGVDQYALQHASWYCSPWRRTVDTANEIARCLQHPPRHIEQDVRLRELDFGEWEGSLWSEIHRDHAAAMEHWGEDWVNRCPPAGETFAAQVSRCSSWLQDWCSGTGESSSIVVTHGGSIRALVCDMLGWPLQQAMNFQIDTARFTVLNRYTVDAPWTLRVLNGVHV